MRTEQIGRLTIEFYDGIEIAPINNYFNFNKMMLIDSGIGAEPETIDSSFSKLTEFVKMNREEDSLKEIDNIRQGLYFIANRINPKAMAYVYLIKSIKKRGKDLSNTNNVVDVDITDVEKTVNLLSQEGLTKGMINNVIEVVKKKLKMN